MKILPFTIQGHRLAVMYNQPINGRWEGGWIVGRMKDDKYLIALLGTDGKFSGSPTILYGTSEEDAIRHARRFADIKRSYAEVCAAEIDGW